MKGKIIGREGRNIRTFESITGVEVIIDDTPQAIILSCFDAVRREIARLSLHKLVKDGRIHPARIEGVVKKTKENIEQEIIEIGKRTIIDLGIHKLHPKLIRMIGRMKYRSSYGQNLLQHSREVSNLCAIMATELGLNEAIQSVCIADNIKSAEICIDNPANNVIRKPNLEPIQPPKKFENIPIAS